MRCNGARPASVPFWVLVRSEDVLSQAWDVEADDVKGLLAGQKETAIIKVEKGKVCVQYCIVDASALYPLAPVLPVRVLVSFAAYPALT